MEKHFSIDAGNGEKMDGCPYSLYEDGHDVKDYIIPPKGHEFVGFKLVELPNNQIYDGKLVAQYKRLPAKERYASLARSVIIALGILAVVGIIIALTVSVFKSPKTPKKNKPKTKDEVVATTDSTTTSKPVAEITPTQPKNDTAAAVSADTAQTPVDAGTTTAGDVNEQFKKEFWDLIHQRTIMMDPYDALYKNYKDQVSGEEYDYLRHTMLQNYKVYKEWYQKLQRIPQEELVEINTIDALVQKMR